METKSITITEKHLELALAARDELEKTTHCCVLAQGFRAAGYAAVTVGFTRVYLNGMLSRDSKGTLLPPEACVLREAYDLTHPEAHRLDAKMETVQAMLPLTFEIQVEE